MRIILLNIAVLISLSVTAQVTKVSLQASGLTCSMCSNSINKALRTLDFVEKVDPNIQTSTFEITFKPDAKIDFEAIKEKVEKAGFSVASFIATVDFKGLRLEPGKPIMVSNITLYFINGSGQLATGPKPVKMISKGFVPAKEYKKNAAALPAIEKGAFYATI